MGDFQRLSPRLQQPLNMRFDLPIIAIALHVFTARMDVAERALAVQQEAHARERCVLVAVEPPAIQCPPIGIDRHGKFEPKLLRGALD